MSVKTKLELIFLDSGSKKFKLGIDEPKEDLDLDEIRTTRDLILERDIFRPKDKKLVKLDQVNQIRTETKEIIL